MCPKPLIATAGSMKADARIIELHLWAVAVIIKDCPTAVRQTSPHRKLQMIV